MFRYEKVKNVVPLLFVYAKKPCSEPVDDEITLGMGKIWEKAYVKEKRGTFHNGIVCKGQHTMGVHICTCGEVSEDADYLIEPPRKEGLILGTKKEILEEYKDWFDTIGFHPNTKTTRETMVEYVSPVYATNTLCIHYLRDHREEVPEAEMKKIWDILARFNTSLTLS